jgi:adenine-specific DNA-methyltransferase
MMRHGCFTHIFHPGRENMFEGASIDIMVFRYCRNPKLLSVVIYNGRKQHIANHDGCISITENDPSENTFCMKDHFDIFVGMVSGKDSIFKNDTLGNIHILTKEDKFEPYIYLTSFPSGNAEIDNYLTQHKETLMKRRIKKMTNDNWFEWGAPRNVKKMEQFKGTECIYMYNLTRKPNIAFKGTVDYFGGNLLVLIPKTTGYHLNKLVDYFNSDHFRNRFIFSGRFKMTHNILSHTYIPNIC